MRFRALSLLVSLVTSCEFAVAQTVGPPAPVKDPTAVSLASLSLSATAGATPLSDATLNGTVTYTTGSDLETGTATLQLLGNQDSNVVLNLSAGTRQEIRSQQAGGWAGTDGVWYSEATHNCWTDTSAFFPALSLQTALGDPTTGLLYLGATTLNGAAANHLQIYHTLAGQSATTSTTIQQLSTMDIYLDSTSNLPVAVDFNTHPDNDFGTNIPVEFQFGSYQAVNGIQVPFHIQKYLQGSLLLDITVTSASINSGIPASTFTIPPTAVPPPTAAASSGGAR